MYINPVLTKPLLGSS